MSWPAANVRFVRAHPAVFFGWRVVGSIGVPPETRAPALRRTNEEEALWIGERIGVGASSAADRCVRPHDIGAGEELIIAAPGDHHAIRRAAHTDDGPGSGDDFAGGEDDGGIVARRQAGRIRKANQVELTAGEALRAGSHIEAVSTAAIGRAAPVCDHQGRVPGDIMAIAKAKGGCVRAEIQERSRRTRWPLGRWPRGRGRTGNEDEFPELLIISVRPDMTAGQDREGSGIGHGRAAESE